MASSLHPPTYPSPLRHLTELFDPAQITLSAAEWRQWQGLDLAELQARMDQRFHAPHVTVRLTEWLPLRALLLAACTPEAVHAVEALEAAPPDYPAELRQAVPEVLRGMVLRFRSGNRVPIERTHISREEWYALETFASHPYREALAAYEAQEARKANARKPGKGTTDEAD